MNRTEYSIPYTPKMSVVEAHALLTRPQSTYEMTNAGDNTIPVRIWKNGPQTIADVFTISQRFPDREFIIFNDDRVTYFAFGKAVASLARHFADRGVAKGSIIALVGANSAEWLVAYFAATLIGAIIAPMNQGASISDLRTTLELSTACIVICDSDRLNKVLACVDGLEDFNEIIVWRLPSNAAPRSVIRMEDILGRVQAWSELDEPILKPNAVRPEDDAAIFFTSGTTGQPKGVLTTHRANVYNVFHAGFRNARRYLMTGETPPESDPNKAPQAVNLVSVPLFHVSGVISTVMPMMCRGAKVVFMPWWTIESGLRVIERERVTFAGGVPTVACQILDYPSRSKYDLASLTQMIYGGAPSPIHLPAQAAKAGMTPGQSWGMTETTGGVITTVAAEFLARPDSCGVVSAVHDLEIRDENGAKLPFGEIGELWIRGPQVMKRYWRNPEATAQTLVDGWLRTGDLARLDTEGYCYIVDRLKDMIICAGENVYCGEIEAALQTIPDIAEIVALGIPHSTLGEQVAAVVVPKRGNVLTEQYVRVCAGKLLAPIKVPTRVIISAQPLPRNDAGKVRKDLLRELFVA